MKHFGNSCFLREPPLSTNPPISEQFFHYPPLCPNVINKKPPPRILGEEETMGVNKNVVARVSHKEYKDSLLNNKYNIVNTKTF